jgi:hypothetical protein
MSTTQPVFEISENPGGQKVSVPAPHLPNGIDQDGAISHTGNQAGRVA